MVVDCDGLIFLHRPEQQYKQTKLSNRMRCKIMVSLGVVTLFIAREGFQNTALPRVGGLS